MQHELLVLSMTAAGIGLLHTLIGPDHYVPFVVIGRARRWSHGRLAVITALCGLGHVLSSVLLGFVGIALGVALIRLVGIEEVRGELASYLLIGFGLAYGVWGVWRGLKGRVHQHPHLHANGQNHDHEHTHLDEDHQHPHHAHPDRKNVTVWTLFVIFVLGPCEPLIPLLMYPAAKHSMVGVALVATVFGAVTMATMVGVALLLYTGVRFLSAPWLERYMHAMAGVVIALSGGAILLGL